MKPLFISHHSDDDAAVDSLFDELRLRGLRSWVDHRNGFFLGDSQAAVARRIIMDECSGFALYARAQNGHCAALESRPFIRNVEIPAALDAVDADSTYIVFPLLCGLSYPDLREVSLQTLGEDLSVNHGCQMEHGEGALRSAMLASRALLRKFLARDRATSAVKTRLDLSFYSHEEMPASASDSISLDWTGALDHLGCRPGFSSDRLLPALMDVRREISRAFGSLTLRIGGTLHLSVAVALGRVFAAPTRFHFEMEQNGEIWSTACPRRDNVFFSVRGEDGDVSSGDLFVGVSATRHNIRQAVRAYVRRTERQPREYVWFQSLSGLADDALPANGDCCTAAKQVADVIAAKVPSLGTQRIHLFISAPQSLAAMIGRNMNALPEIQTYEFQGGHYYPSLALEDKYLEPEVGAR